MRTTIKFVFVVISTFIMCSCTSMEEKMEKALMAYQKEGYTILSQSETLSEVDHFLLVQKDNQIFIDELLGKKSKHLVFPKEDGYYTKQIQLSMQDGVPACSFALLNEGNKVPISNEEYIVIQSDKLKGKQTLVFANKNAINAPCYVYCVSNPDTIYSLGKWKDLWIEKDSFILKYCESIDKLFGEDYKSNTFDVIMSLSTEDMSFKGFYGNFGINADFDIDYIKNKYPDIEFRDQNNEIRFPFSWFGTPDIMTIKDAIDNYESEADKIQKEIDRIFKEREAELKKLERQQSQNSQNNYRDNAGKGNRIQWYPCPVCGGRGYSEGFDSYGRRANHKCSWCGGTGGHWE